MKQKLFILILCVFFSSLVFSKDITIGMTHPTPDQIENINVLYQSDLINLKKIKLMCIYNENELTNYKKSYEYVKSRNLTWVEFFKVKGIEKPENLFKRNIWTEQFKTLFNKLDGIIFTGGMDIPPIIYKSKNNLLTYATTPVRILYEVSFLYHLIGGYQKSDLEPFLNKRQNFVILGICLGHQMMNVAAGGSMYQDIPTEIYNVKFIEDLIKLPEDMIHSSSYYKLLYPLKARRISPHFHRIRLLKNRFFNKELKFKTKYNPYILSSHHQAVKKTGKNLVVTALSMDNKIIEGVQHKIYKNVIGIQFHPEYRNLYKKGIYFLKDTSMKLINLKEYLINTKSMKFHKEIWNWFSNALKYN